MQTDARGVPVTGADAPALAAYEAALRSFQSYVGDPIAAIDAGLAAAPAFVTGHLLKTFAFYTLGERQFAGMANDALDEAKAHASQANARERALIGAAERLCAGEWDAASLALDRVLAEHPRDALALQTGHLMDFFRGDAQNLRNRVSRVMPHWNREVPGYSFVLGMHAFGLEEMNQYGEAEETGRRALAIEPRDGWSVHAVTHVMEMQGRIAEGVEWLASRERDWAPDNGFAFHNFWHLGLFRLDGGDVAGALALYDRHVHPEPATFTLSLIDATAMLWRIMLEDGDVGDRWQAVADDWAQRLERNEPGFYAFNDVHAIMAFVASGRTADVEHVLAALRRATDEPGSNAAMSRDVGLPLAQAIVAFGQGRYAAAVDGIEAVRNVAHRFGGSHAQRDVLTLTLIEAATRAGDRARASHYIAERLMHKPASAWGPRLVRRLDERTALAA
jgi:tetratricopeptide (TPR) repeat protein